MTGTAPQRERYVTISRRSERSKLTRVLYGMGLGALSILLQRMLHPWLAPDSYQLLLSAVAISVMYAGVRAGLAALLLTGAAKWFLFPPQESSLLRFALFL